MSVTRRKLLKVLGTSATVLSSSGCLALADGDTTEERGTRTDTTTTTSGPDPQPPPARDIFDGVPCPSFNDADRTVCWHTRSDDTVAVKPSQVVFKPVGGNDKVETITFTLDNTLDTPILFNPYSWAVKRKTEDGWTHVAPDDVAYEPLYELDPGKAYRWIISRESHPTPNESRAVYPTVNVENGRHAFVLTGSLADDSPNATETSEGLAGEAIEWVTLFDVQRIYR